MKHPHPAAAGPWGSSTNTSTLLWKETMAGKVLTPITSLQAIVNNSASLPDRHN